MWIPFLEIQREYKGSYPYNNIDIKFMILNVLIACPKVETNYICSLNHFLQISKSVYNCHRSLYDFWDGGCKSDTDILHIQWPEALFDWSEPTAAELALLNDKLQDWSRSASIISTVHNYHPHLGESESFRRLYRRVYEFSEGIIHLGQASKRWLPSAYSNAASTPQTVISHGDQSCLQNSVSQSEARQHLNLQPGDKVVLSLGHHRHMHELRRAVNSFHEMGDSNRKLIIAGKTPLPNSRSRRYRNYLYWKIKVDPRIRLYEGWIEKNQIQFFVNAADVLLIPRKNVLNSGNVSLGFTFGVPVVGPNEGVVGEVLASTGNPVFDPCSPKQIAEAISKALKDDNLGMRNKMYSNDYQDWQHIAKQHISFYQKVMRI